MWQFKYFDINEKTAEILTRCQYLTYKGFCFNKGLYNRYMVIYMENQELRIIFSHIVKFDESALRNIEQNYKKDMCSEVQSKIIQGITKIICEFINIPELAMKGAALKALREWESLNDTSINAIAEMPIGKGLNAVKEIFNIGKRMIKEMVSTPKDKNENYIDISFERAFKFFLEYYYQHQH